MILETQQVRKATQSNYNSEEMKFLLILALVGAALAEESPLKAILKSPSATLKLYNSFKGEQHLAFQAAEDRLRFRLFRKNAEFVAEENSVEGETAKFALNFFSTMTDSEKQAWLGFNVTGALLGSQAEPSPVVSVSDIPASKLWTNEGKVTAVKNQGGCGSCWTFGAVGGLETRYARKAGVLRSFAEQEYLDCVYEGQRDGCGGGWMNACYEYSAKAGGRLAKTADYQYTQRDGYCQGSSRPDAMIAASIEGNVPVGRSEAANIEALAEGSLAVAFEVTNRFHSYSSGIFKDTTCSGWPNHAVTAVGYTPQYVLVKNSWGKWWGDEGYVRFARNHHNCNLWNYSSYPELSETGVADDGGNDKATDYQADEGDKPEPEPTSSPDPDCFDSYPPCYEYWCDVDYVRNDYCRKTCGVCGDGGDDCPSGTIRCSDGVCRHEHMC